MNEAFRNPLKPCAFALSLCALLMCIRAEDVPPERAVFKPDRVRFTAFRTDTDPKTGERVIVVELEFMDRGNAVHHLRLGEHIYRFTVVAFRVRPRKYATEKSDFVTEVDLRTDADGAICQLTFKDLYDIPLRIK